MTTKMNWNLKKNSIVLYCFIQSLLCIEIKAQSKQDFEMGFSLAPAINSNQVSGNDWEAYLKSAKSEMQNHYTIQAHAWVKKSIGKKSDVQLGLGYADLAFERLQSDLKYADPTYKGIGTGVIPDKSSADKRITYTYHFRNLQVPVIWNALIGHTKDYRYKFYSSAGLIFNVLMSHALEAETAQGYLIDSQSKFQLDSSGFTPNRLSLNLQIGLKCVYKLDKEKSIFIQPLLAYFPFSITSENTTVNPLLFQVNAGIMIPFDQK